MKGVRKGIPNRESEKSWGVDGTTVNQILEMIARLSDKKILVERRENPLTIKHVTLSPDKLKTLGWTPKTNLENGIQQIWESKQIEFI